MQTFKFYIFLSLFFICSIPHANSQVVIAGPEEITYKVYNGLGYNNGVDFYLNGLHIHRLLSLETLKVSELKTLVITHYNLVIEEARRTHKNVKVDFSKWPKDYEQWSTAIWTSERVPRGTKTVISLE